jgi:hypothetical protein
MQPERDSISHDERLTWEADDLSDFDFPRWSTQIVP